MGGGRAERWILPALVVALAISGCARTRTLTPVEAELPSGFPDHSLVQIEDLLDASTDGMRSFRARAAVSLNSPERSGRFSSEIRERRGDSLYLSISPGLGIEAVRVLVTPDSVFVYDRIDNRVRYGSNADAEKLIPVPLGGDELSRNLLGHVVPRLDSNWEIRADSNLYYLSSPSGAEHFVVDPSLWRVIRYERRSERGALLEQRLFEEFTSVEGHVFPRRLVFRRPLEETTFVLTYRDVDPDPDDLSFDLRVSDDARWTPVGE